LSDCGDAVYARQQQYFQRFESALVYTPGDNDWTDCQRRGDDPLERLQALRRRFFAAPRSQGQRPLALQRQSDVMPAYARYVENLRWQYPPQAQGVVFRHLPHRGPRQRGRCRPGRSARRGPCPRGGQRRWISAAFALARSQGARALVLAPRLSP